MTETTTAVEEAADEIKPPVDEQDREIACRSDSSPEAAASEISQAAIITPGVATGHRKKATARVRIIPGSGQWAINGRTLRDYFPNKVHQQLVSDPFMATGVTGSCDVIARIDGGGVTGQVGTLRLGIARALNEIDTEVSCPTLKKAEILTRDAHAKGRKKVGLKKARKTPQYSKR